MKTNFSLTAKVIKRHSDFVYVKIDKKINEINEIIECKVRERLKKEKIEIFVGDNVKIEKINPDTRQAVITEVFKRTNFIPRPSVANVDQVIVVTSLAAPGLDFVQLNRYLCLAKLYNIPAVICINKIDLKQKNKDILEKITAVYKPLDYKIVFTSALVGSGIKDLQKCLSGKISVLAGMSGVGKSSLLNKLCPDLNLKTKTVSFRTKRGTHATRHVELIEVFLPEENSVYHVADTPGFSYLKFDNIMPYQVADFFDEIKALSDKCHFSDCLHLKEENCNVLNNIDKIDETRYKSYKIFIEEAFEHKKKIECSSQKQEEATKLIDAPDRTKTRLIKTGIHGKEESRKKIKQKINRISILDNVYYNDDSD